MAAKTICCSGVRPESADAPDSAAPDSEVDGDGEHTASEGCARPKKTRHFAISWRSNFTNTLTISYSVLEARIEQVRRLSCSGIFRGLRPRRLFIIFITLLSWRKIIADKGGGFCRDMAQFGDKWNGSRRCSEQTVFGWRWPNSQPQGAWPPVPPMYTESGMGTLGLSRAAVLLCTYF